MQHVAINILISFLVLIMGCSNLDVQEISKDETTKSESSKLNEVNYNSGPSNVRGAFLDKTKAYGLSGVRGNNFYAIDFNNDLYTDLVVIPDFYSTPEFYEFLPHVKKFKKITYNPFNKHVPASYLIFADINSDLVLDVVVGVLNQKPEISTFSPRIFQGVITSKGINYIEKKILNKIEVGVTAAISVIDVDLDGKLDLYLGNWFLNKKDKVETVPDRLFKGDGNFGFVDISYLLSGELSRQKNVSIYPNACPTYAVSTCDIDQDGYPDILTSSSNGYGNKLWLNFYDSKNSYRLLRDYSLETNYISDFEGRLDPKGGGNTFFSGCADYNNDGIMDIYVGELTRKYDSLKRDRSSIMTGKTESFPPNFFRTEYINDSVAKNNWNQGDRRAVWFDYNLDGLQDLLVDNSGFPPHSRLVLFEQKSDHSFEDISKFAGIDIVNPTSSVIIDVNRDNRMDIITGQVDARDKSIPNRIYLFENNSNAENKKSVKVYLRGMESNTLGLGATVILQTNLGTKRKWVEYSRGGLPSQNEEGVIFGLDATEKVDAILVRWPSQNKNQKRYTSYNVSLHEISKYEFKENRLVLTLCENEITKLGQTRSCN